MAPQAQVALQLRAIAEREDFALRPGGIDS